MANGLFGGGDGSYDNPFIVEDRHDLNAVRNNLRASYQQSGEIDLTGYSWEPIGRTRTLSGQVYNTDFVGVYFGASNTIRGLTNPLFGSLGKDLHTLESALVYTLNLEDVNIHSYTGYAGALAMSAYACSISGVHAKGTVNCDTVDAYGDPTQSVGGLLGRAWDADVSDCSFEGVINSGARSTGGLVGESQNSKFSSCRSRGTLHGFSSLIGGFAGNIHTDSPGYAQTSTFTRCYSMMDITVDELLNDVVDSVGGFVGYMGGYPSTLILSQCYASGSVTAVTCNDVGGFAGHITNCNLSNCYASGDVKGFANVGGFVGLLTSNSQGRYPTSRIAYCHSVGNVSAYERFGGFIGTNQIDSDFRGLVLTSIYYDTQKSGCTDTGKGEPKLTKEMLTESTFVDWSFGYIWEYRDGYEYPVFLWHPEIPQTPPSPPDEIEVNYYEGYRKMTPNGIRVIVCIDENQVGKNLILNTPDGDIKVSSNHCAVERISTPKGYKVVLLTDEKLTEHSDIVITPDGKKFHVLTVPSW